MHCKDYVRHPMAHSHIWWIYISLLNLKYPSSHDQRNKDCGVSPIVINFWNTCYFPPDHGARMKKSLCRFGQKNPAKRSKKYTLRIPDPSKRGIILRTCRPAHPLPGVSRPFECAPASGANPPRNSRGRQHRHPAEEWEIFGKPKAEILPKKGGLYHALGLQDPFRV